MMSTGDERFILQDIKNFINYNIELIYFSVHLMFLFVTL